MKDGHYPPADASQHAKPGTGHTGTPDLEPVQCDEHSLGRHFFHENFT